MKKLLIFLLVVIMQNVITQERLNCLRKIQFISSSSNQPLHHIMAEHAMERPDREYSVLNVFTYNPNDPAHLIYQHDDEVLYYNEIEQGYKTPKGEDEFYVRYDIPIQFDDYNNLQKWSKKSLKKVLDSIEGLSEKEYVIMSVDSFFHMITLSKFSDFLGKKTIKKIEVIGNKQALKNKQIKEGNHILCVCNDFASLANMWPLLKKICFPKGITKVIDHYLTELKKISSPTNNNSEAQFAHLVGNYLYRFAIARHYYCKDYAQSFFETIRNTYQKTISDARYKNAKFDMVTFDDPAFGVTDSAMSTID